mgnify:CR=1 FL=1
MSRQRKAPQAKARTVPSVLSWRFAFVLLTLSGVFTALVVRAAWLQVVEPEMLVSQGDMRSLRVEADTVLRGMIVDRHGEELAVSVPVEAIWADPKIVIERHAAADERRWHALADILQMTPAQLLQKVGDNPQRRFIYLQRQVNPAVVDYVKKLKVPGIYFRQESRRYYPAGEVAASGAPFAMASSAIFGSWSAPFVSAFTALACFTSLGSWMMLVGEAGKGFRYILSGMNSERILIAAECIGDAKWFIEKATGYAKDRSVFARPIGQNQGVQFPIARCYAQMRAAELMVYHAARVYDEGGNPGEEANMAKLLASEASWAAADMCVQTFGGFGFAEEYDVERKFREARLYTVAPISTNLILSYLAEHVLGLPRSY